MTEQISGSENECKEDNSITVEGKPIGAAVNSTSLKRKRFSVCVECQSWHYGKWNKNGKEKESSPNLVFSVIKRTWTSLYFGFSVFLLNFSSNDNVPYFGGLSTGCWSFGSSVLSWISCDATCDSIFSSCSLGGMTSMSCIGEGCWRRWGWSGGGLFWTIPMRGEGVNSLEGLESISGFWLVNTFASFVWVTDSAVLETASLTRGTVNMKSEAVYDACLMIC